MAEPTHIRFGDCEIDVAGFALRRGGTVREIEPQVLELLIYLARNADRLITKDDLIENVWHGRVVSDTAITSRIKSARQAIGDDGTQQKLIRTVHGRGVRFVSRVETERHDATDSSGAGSAAGAPHRAPDSTEPRTWPAIAVLPFANIGGERDQDCFVDGLTEDIVTDLSRFGHLRVVPRAFCFRYRESGDDLQKICRALAADYVVTGSVRRRGSHLRLSARLIAADSAQQLWADRFDRDAEDVFLVADELVGTIVATLAGRVRSVGSALAKRKPPANLAAYECVLRAQAALTSGGNLHEEDEAGRLFEQALISDPDYPRAHAGLAMVLVRDWYRGGEDTQVALDRALDHAQRAVAIDNHDNECEETLAWVLLQRRQFDLAEQHYRRAIELNPYSPDELAAMGSACSYLGRPGEGIGWFELAKRTDPFFDPPWYWNLLGVTHFNARHYDEAAAALEHLSNPPMWIRAYAAASHALAGRTDAASRIAAFLAEHAPGFSARTLLIREPYKNPADREHLADGLHKAGLLSDRTEGKSPNAAAEASRYYLVGRSSFIHSPGAKPSFEAAR